MNSLHHGEPAVKTPRTYSQNPGTPPASLSRDVAPRKQRKLTPENSHELHSNPYDPKDLVNVMQWAREHWEICEACRNKKPRKFVMPYPETWAENYNLVGEVGE